MRRSRGRCLLVASSGGHLSQLHELRDGWATGDRLWVTFATPDAGELLSGERVVFAHHPTNRNLANLLRNATLAVGLLLRERPRVVISTGAGVAVPFVYVAWLLRIPVIWVEGIERVESLSISARLVAPAATRLFVQWPEAAKLHRRAEYAGSLW